jgi:hypothetical protein
VELATALASCVLPVPGSPYRMTPCIKRCNNEAHDKGACQCMKLALVKLSCNTRRAHLWRLDADVFVQLRVGQWQLHTTLIEHNHVCRKQTLGHKGLQFTVRGWPVAAPQPACMARLAIRQTNQPTSQSPSPRSPHLWWLDAYVFVQLRVGQWQLHSLLDSPLDPPSSPAHKPAQQLTSNGLCIAALLCFDKISYTQTVHYLRWNAHHTG